MRRVLPILFNAPMVRAILDGQKTSTRRIAKGIIPWSDNDDTYWNVLKNGEWTGPWTKDVVVQNKAPVQPGDILYVRETYCPDYFDFVNQYGNKHGYKADYDKAILSSDIIEPRWIPSIHMPKEAARIWLGVTDVGVERIQDMDTEDDRNFIAEGASDKHDFINIWDFTVKDRGKYGWYANPWVWVIEFERCEKPKEG